MMIWEILGCDETKDKEMLKIAYRKQLKTVNPEDDPEGFMRLREAYEEALRLAEVMGDREDLTDDSNLLREIKSVYNNYSRRISVMEWEELLDRDEFVALDSSQDSFDVLIRFLMDKFFVPKDVWRLIVERFDIEARYKELSEIYPENFIEYVINNSIYDDVLDFSLLECRDDVADTFLDRYFRLDLAIRKHEYQEQKKLINLIGDMDVYHPYFEMLKIKSRLQEFENIDIEQETENELENRKSVYEDLFQDAIILHSDFPEDINFMGICGDIKLLLGDYEDAGEYYEKALEIKPDNYVMKGKIAEQKMCIGEYAKSRDIFMELLRINHYDNSARTGMIRANTELIKELENDYKENPQDKKIPMEISWSLYQIYKFKDAITYLDGFEPDEAQICEYNNLKGRVYLCLNQYNQALQCFETWKSAIEAIPADDESKEAKDKKKRYGYVNFLIGDCYLKIKDYEIARKYLEIALSMEHDEIVLAYEAMCELEYETKNYGKCIEVCEALLDREKRSFIAYNYKSKASLKLEFIKEAIDASSKAMEIYPYIAEPYETQIGVYLKFNQIEGARGVVERYKAMEIDSDRMNYCQGKILVAEDKYEEAIKILDTVNVSSNENPTDFDNPVKLMELKAFCNEMIGKSQRALEIYEELLKLEPNHKNVCGRMGIILKNQGKLTKSMDMFTRQIEIAPDVISYVNRGTLNRFFKRYKSALEDFEEAIKLDPENGFCYSRIGLIYETHREFCKALDNYDMALKFTSDDSAKSQLYIYKARTLQCMNRFDDSKVVYDMYIEEFGLNPDVGYDLAELLLRMGDINYATKVLEECINKFDYDENVKQCVVSLISIYGEEGYLSRANETFQLAINRFGNQAEFYGIMGEVFRDNGLYDQAVKHYETAVKLDIDCKQNYYSELVEVLKKKNPLRQDLKKYVQKALVEPTNMTNPDACINMSRLHRALRKYKEAMVIIDKAFKMKRCSGCFYSSCHDALYEKGLIYEAMKDYESARLCYKQALSICGHNALYVKCLKRIEGK